MSKSEYLNPAIYKELYRVMQRDNVNALRVSLETGMRIGDVLSLRPEQVKGRTIAYIAAKTGKSGKARITEALKRELLAGANNGFVFPGR